MCKQLDILGCPDTASFWEDAARQFVKERLHGDAWDAWLRAAAKTVDTDAKAAVFLDALDCWSSDLDEQLPSEYPEMAYQQAMLWEATTVETILRFVDRERDPVTQLRMIYRALHAGDGKLEWEMQPSHLMVTSGCTYKNSKRLDCIVDWGDFARAALDHGLDDEAVQALIESFRQAETLDATLALIGDAAMALYDEGLLEHVKVTHAEGDQGGTNAGTAHELDALRQELSNAHEERDRALKGLAEMKELCDHAVTQARDALAQKRILVDLEERARRDVAAARATISELQEELSSHPLKRWLTGPFGKR